MTTLTIPEFIDFITTNRLSQETSIEEHQYTSDFSHEELPGIGIGTACCTIAYPENQQIQYCERFGYSVGDGLSEVKSRDVIDDDFPLTWDFNFTVIGNKTDASKVDIDDQEIADIIKKYVALDIDYSKLEQFTLNDKEIAYPS